VESTVPSSKIQSRKQYNPVARLLGYLKPYIPQALLTALCIVIYNITTVLKPRFIKIITDNYITEGTFVNKGISLTAVSIGYMAVTAIGMVFFYLQIYLITKIGQSITRTLREDIFKTIQLLPLSYLDRTSAGRLITRTTNDVEAVSELFTDILVSLLKDAVLLIAIIWSMFSINVKLTLYSFVVMPFMFALIFYIRKKIHDNWIILKQITSRLNGAIAENISGMKIVQIFNGQKEKLKEFRDLTQSYFDKSLVQMKMHSLSGPSSNIFESAAIGIVLWFGMRLMQDGTVEIGDIIALSLYIRQFFMPVTDLAESFTSIESAVVSAQRIWEITDEKHTAEDLDEGIVLKDIKGKIEFRNVWFAYDEDNYVLKDVSFTIEPGDTCAIVGETGSGKTTIISLISGFYKINKGEILIDGINIDDISRKSLRRAVGVVLQDVFLFSGNIKENITLNDNIPEGVIMNAVKASHADEMISEYKEGIMEPVMERGSTFSMGERQLLSFARALAHEPSIFVLDEATANIDTETEILIQKAVEEASKDRTTIIIAHRLSTIKNADNIIVMEHGKIIEQGNHEELMEKNGNYREMVEKGSKKPEAV